MSGVGLCGALAEASRHQELCFVNAAEGTVASGNDMLGGYKVKIPRRGVLRKCPRLLESLSDTHQPLHFGDGFVVETNHQFQRSTFWAGHDVSFDLNSDWFDRLLPNVYHYPSYVLMTELFKTVRWSAPNVEDVKVPALIFEHSVVVDQPKPDIRSPWLPMCMQRTRP